MDFARWLRIFSGRLPHAFVINRTGMEKVVEGGEFHRKHLA